MLFWVSGGTQLLQLCARISAKQNRWLALRMNVSPLRGSEHFLRLYPALKRWATFATSLQDWTCEDPFDSLALAQGRLSVLPSSTTVAWGRGRPPHSRREGAVRDSDVDA